MAKRPLASQSNRLVFCTYFDSNYLTRGLALYASLVRWCSTDFTLWVLCFDERTYTVLKKLNYQNIRLISLEEFETYDKELAKVKSTRTTVEYYWTCTPSLPIFVLQKDKNLDVVTYLDADLYFFSDPVPIYETFSNYSIMIVGHRYSPKHLRLEKESGTFNVGILWFKNDKNGLECLHWWRQRCIAWCYKRHEAGKFGDQKYLDDWPTRFHGVKVLDHKGVNLAPWNIENYEISVMQNRVYVDSEPVVVYHFHGVQTLNQWIASPGPDEYSIPAVAIETLYMPYLKTLWSLQRKSKAQTAQGVTLELREALRLLLAIRLVIVSPSIVGLVVVKIASRLLDQERRIAAAFKAYEEGEMKRARALFLKSIVINPTFFLRRPIVSGLVGTFIGKGRTRDIKRQLTTIIEKIVRAIS